MRGTINMQAFQELKKYMSPPDNQFPHEFEAPGLGLKVVAAFQGMHVSPAKHSYGSVTDA